MANRSKGLPQSIKAIALDTNAGAQGLLDLDGVERLIGVLDDQELDVQIWIPEVVIWEWAEHAHDLSQRTSTTISSASRKLERAGMEGPPEFDSVSSVQEVVAAYEEDLESYFLEHSNDPAIRILRLIDHPEVAISGLRDQVLRQGAGRFKTQDGRLIKTGAADSAAWRLVAAEADDISRVVLVTKDGDAERHFQSNAAPLVVKDLWTLKKELMKLTPGSAYARERVHEAVRTDLPAMTQQELALVPLLGALPAEVARDRDTAYEPEMQAHRISKVDDIEDIEVSRSDGTAIALAHVTVDIAVDYIRFDSEYRGAESDSDLEFDVQAVARVGLESEPGSNEWNAWIDEIEFT